MARTFNLKRLPRAAILLAGAATAAFSSSRRRKMIEPDMVQDLKRAVAQLETQISTIGDRLSHLESEIESRSAALAGTPSSSQIIAAMEQLLSRTMSSLDDRLTNQTHAIEVLKTTMSQTDGLLERVLESLDALQTTSDSVVSVKEDLLSHPRVSQTVPLHFEG